MVQEKRNLLTFYKYQKVLFSFRSQSSPINWSAGVEIQLRKFYDKVKVLMSQLETDSTNAILRDIFGSHTISLTRDDNVRIAESVQTVMASLSSEVTKQDSILGGTLVGVGSFWDGTRVGEAPNEFDYMYVLRDVNRYITGCYKCGIGEYRMKCIECNPLTGTGSMLSNFRVRNRLCACINRSIEDAAFPKNLHHGGVLSPYFSGVRKNGPAITLLFVWTGDQYKSKPLLISVDVTIGIRPIHIWAIGHDEYTLQATQHFQNKVRVLPESFLIADATLDTVWQRTTASMETSVVLNMRPGLLNTIKMLKILNDTVLTIREPTGNSHMTRQLEKYSKSRCDDARNRISPTLAERDGCSSFDDSHCNFINISTSEGSSLTNKSNKIQEVILSLVVERNLHITQLSSDRKKKGQPDIKAKRMSRLASKLCHLLLDDTEVVSKDFDFSPIIKPWPTIRSAQCGNPGPTNLSYLPDILDPDQCRLLLEDCKPLITLKSCIFKYVMMELLQVGEVSWQCSKNDDSGFDLDLLVRILKKIQKSKQMQHPLLGYPILTYSVSPRVQHCAGQNRRITQDTENRLSEILYDVLGLLIETLDRKSHHDTFIEMTTRL